MRIMKDTPVQNITHWHWVYVWFPRRTVDGGWVFWEWTQRRYREAFGHDGYWEYL